METYSRPRPWGLGAVALTVTAAGWPASGAAQFATSQVSGPGAPPLLMTASSAQHEDLVSSVAGVTYNVYRHDPTDPGFRCIDSNRTDPGAWNGDPAEPGPGQVFWYTVTADDLWGENRHGSDVPITARCACSGPAPVAGKAALVNELIVDGLASPTYVTIASGDSSRLYVVGEWGLIWLVERGQLAPDPFLDISAKADAGTWSVAFHPDYPTDPRFWVIYGTRTPETVLEEYRVGADLDRADPTSGRTIWSQPQISVNHNGGQLLFGPHDGYLYMGLGDGGNSSRAQLLDSQNGKVLRFDVDGPGDLDIPPTNPFVGTTGAREEIWAYGLRHAWRFAFDLETYDLYLADVGGVCREEIDIGLAGDGGGENYGWNYLEGIICASGNPTCDTALGCGASCTPDCAGFTMPAVDYPRNALDCAVIGGQVYRGCRMPDLGGTYFYADFCSGIVRSFVYAGGVATEETEWPSLLVRSPSSFGIDARGEMFIIEYHATDGALYRIVPE